MMFEEAEWISKYIKILISNKHKIKSVIDIGSSTLEYRTKIQPYIDKLIFSPLRKKKIPIYHLDKKRGEGVDIVCSTDKLSSLNKKFSLVICSNLLEHVKNPDKVIHDINNLVEEGGFMILTVPFKYRYHADPIDTFFRPSPEELESLVSENKVIAKAVISGTAQGNPLIMSLASINALLHDRKFKLILKNLYHTLQRPKVTCVIFEK